DECIDTVLEGGSVVRRCSARCSSRPEQRTRLKTGPVTAARRFGGVSGAFGFPEPVTPLRRHGIRVLQITEVEVFSPGQVVAGKFLPCLPTVRAACGSVVGGVTHIF